MFRLALFTTILFSVITFTANAQKSKKVYPCDTTEECRQFDFWVGTWEAFDTTGKLIGNSTIDIIQNGCVIRENWSSGGGAYTGTSYNHYNKSTGKWHQHWIDNQGGALEISGGFKDNQMALESAPFTTKKGKTAINRITWTNNENGTVRQHWEITTDDRKTWSTLFDGLYKKAKK